MKLNRQDEAGSSRSVDGRAARWSGQRDKRRDEFIEAALQAIAQYGPQTATEQVAEYVGVTRTKLYRHFDGAADLHHSIARRASNMLIAEQIPAWKKTVSPVQMITNTVSTHLKWRIENPDLYDYLRCHSLSDDTNGVAAIQAVNNTVATNLSVMIGSVFRTFGLDERMIMPLSFGAVGFVESATTHWLSDPKAAPLREFSAQLSEWMWSLWDTTLRSGGMNLDPHQPVALQQPRR